MSVESKGYDFYKSEDLGCMCGVAAMALKEASRGRMRIRLGRLNGEEHCWNEWGRWRFDITASQFGTFPKVLITERGIFQGKGWRYSKGMELKGYKDFRWGKSQNPTPSLIRRVVG